MAKSASEIVDQAVAVGSLDESAKDAASKAVEIAGPVDTGMETGKLEGSRVFLVQILIDNSGSMQGTEALVRKCLARYAEELAEAMEEGDVEILVCIYLLHGGQIQPYALVDEIIELNDGNHVNDGGTPLLRRTNEILGTLLQKVAELSQGGRQVQSYTMLVTDGEPTDSKEHEGPEGFDPAQIAKVVKGMVEAKQHIVSAVSIHGEATTELLAMGIDRKWILDPHDEAAFEEAIKKVSRVSRSASKGAGAFRTAANEGFR